MDHDEAVKQMAVERYLLDEMAPDAREAFEEHLFDCQECALDLRAGVAFVDAAKAQLLPMIEPSPLVAPPAPAQPSRNPSSAKLEDWLSWLRPTWLRPTWWRPVFAMPAFAALLLALGYQNLVTLPALRAANQPRLVATAPVFEATRGGGHPVVEADRKQGVVLPLELPQQPGVTGPESFAVDLYNPDSKLAWSGAMQLAAQSDDSRRVSLEIPGAMLHNGSYSIAISGVGSNGERTPLGRYTFDLHLKD